MWIFNRPFVYAVFFLICVLITLPLLIESIMDWYLYFLPAVYLLILVIYLSNKAYQGIINRKVRIFPETDLSIRESGYVGATTSGFLRGRSAVIAGSLFLILDFILFRWFVKLLEVLVKSLLAWW